ncbi:pyridoxamine 5'-phosphate oxidase family protein [Streptomyces sp. NPDC007808]|uniref:pyridoxamine 5'-phosphate oxidase family protein n=1 Tax=Streptomyces sp. NPDC007808 TaxID=3364779 RepID=UPI0036CBC233
MYPNDGFRELGRQECLDLLAKVSVGRIVYTRQALPAVLPVNFCPAEDGAVLLRTAASELARAVDGSVVAFEADEVDAVARTGWSVVVTGRAAVVNDPAEREHLSRVVSCPWAPSPVEVVVRVEPELVTGCELVGGRTLYGVRLSA